MSWVDGQNFPRLRYLDLSEHDDHEYEMTRALADRIAGFPALRLLGLGGVNVPVGDLRANATKADLPMPMTGMIYGPAEHDTCLDADYYVSTQVWAWRGMFELGTWLSGGSPWSNATLAKALG